MQIIARRTLRVFWENHPQAKAPLQVWFAEVSRAEWRTPNDVKSTFPSGVDLVGDNRLIFDILHNRFRLVVRVSYRFKCVQIKFVGTHKDYDRINPETV